MRFPRTVAALFLLSTMPCLRGQTEGREENGVRVALVRPSATDADIKEFDEPHRVYVHRGIVLEHDMKLAADRKELLLWIPGTKPRDAKEPEPGKVSRAGSHAFCLEAATLGYHVVALTYPNTISAASCNKEPDPKAFENFRMSIIAGGESPHVTVSRANSIENRLIKLLQLLAKKAPKESWDTFLDADGGINWEKIAVVGQSQGGGHAALIGLNHQVSRVICFGAPKDYSVALKGPAAWHALDSKTSKSRFFAFNHQQDRQGCTPEQQLENLKALGLDELGGVVMVEESKPPYNNSHVLMTNFPGTKVDSRTAHGTMISPKNEERFREVWRYMLTKVDR